MFAKKTFLRHGWIKAFIAFVNKYTMRNFIDIIPHCAPVLTESRGLGARRSGEEFVSTSNPDEKIYVDNVKFYPEGSTQYSSYEVMVAALQQIVAAMQNAGIETTLISEFKPNNLAFGIAVFNTADGKKLGWVKPFATIKHDPTQNIWNNQTGIPGYKYNSKAAAKSQAGMTPQDILTQPSELSADDIVTQIAEKFGATSPLTRIAQSVASGASLPITIPAVQDMSFSAFSDYFTELLHPIALQMGTCTGNAQEAADKYLGKGGFKACSINFGTDKTEGLSDSIMITPDGKKMKVSSKSGQGAQASAKNLIDAAEELKTGSPKLYAKHEKIIGLMKEIKEAGQAGAPLLLGVKYGIISKEDADDITNFKKMPQTTMDAALNMGISKELKALIKGRGTKEPDNLNLYYHCMAAVAFKVADHINDKTNFSNAAGEILNSSAFVQVYTKASETDGKWTLREFNAVWPSNAVAGVAFSASKTYYSTGIKGNFTFKILKKGESADSDSDEEGGKETKPVAKPKSMTGGRTEIQAKSAGKAAAIARIKDKGSDRSSQEKLGRASR